MATRRMTARSRENLKLADRVEVLELAGAWGIKVYRGEWGVGFATAGDGLVMLYSSPGAAWRAAERVRGKAE